MFLAFLSSSFRSYVTSWLSICNIEWEQEINECMELFAFSSPCCLNVLQEICGFDFITDISVHILDFCFLLLSVDKRFFVLGWYDCGNRRKQNIGSGWPWNSGHWNINWEAGFICCCCWNEPSESKFFLCAPLYFAFIYCTYILLTYNNKTSVTDSLQLYLSWNCLDFFGRTWRTLNVVLMCWLPSLITAIGILLFYRKSTL